MLLLFIIIAVFFVGKWVIQSVFMGLFAVGEVLPKKEKEPTTVINNYTTENRLYVDGKEFDNLKKNYCYGCGGPTTLGYCKNGCDN